jgi:hypothetical protein
MAFAWRHRRKTRNISIKTFSVPVEIRSGYPMINSSTLLIKPTCSVNVMSTSLRLLLKATLLYWQSHEFLTGMCVVCLCMPSSKHITSFCRVRKKVMVILRTSPLIILKPWMTTASLYVYPMTKCRFAFWRAPMLLLLEIRLIKSRSIT